MLIAAAGTFRVSLTGVAGEQSFTLDDPAGTRKKKSTDEILDMLLAKKRAPDRKSWLEESGNLADYAG